MRTVGVLALLGAAAGFLLCTEKGKQLTRETGEKLREGRDRLQERFGTTFGADKPVEKTVENALAQPHPDTPVARAFEAAVG